MNEPTPDEFRQLLREAYARVPDSQKGLTRCTDYDPCAGSTYEFEEWAWSKRIREILGINREPLGF